VIGPDLRGSDRRGASCHVVLIRHGTAAGLSNFALAVATYPPHGDAQLLQPSERRARKRARNGIAADHHDVRICRPRVAEHSLERIDVAVDVVQSEDVHRLTY
jgi:hypothetical protein